MAPSVADSDDSRQVFERWIADHRGIIVKIVRSFAADPSDAEDLTQDVLLAIWRSVGSFRGDAKPSTWIWRIALNQAISWQRKAPPLSVDLDSVAEPKSSDATDGSLSINLIYEAIRTLAPIDRALIVLSLEGYRYSEISTMTGLTQTNVGARLSRARARLATQLEGAK